MILGPTTIDWGTDSIYIYINISFGITTITDTLLGIAMRLHLRHMQLVHFSFSLLTDYVHKIDVESPRVDRSRCRLQSAV